MYSGKNIGDWYIGWVSYFLLIFLGISPAIVKAQTAETTTIKGKVSDAVTGEELIGVTIIFPGSNVGAITNMEGNYYIQTTEKFEQVQFSYVGYKTLILPITPGQEQEINVQLEGDWQELGEVVVQEKRKRYRNKDNPAVDLIRQVIAHKAENRPEHYNYVEYEKYEKTQMSLVNTPERLKRNLLLRKYDFITSNIDTTVLEGKALLPFFIEEEIAQEYYRKEPESRKIVVKAEKKVDFGEFIDSKGINAYMQHMYQDIDIYDNNIIILTNQFLSPIADMAPTFYKFYLPDTLTTEGGQKLAKLRFEGRNPAAFMFTGTLYVTLDGHYAVQKVDMEVAKSVSVNWVRDLQIDLDFEKNEDGRYHLSKSSLRADLGLTQNSDGGFYGERMVSFKEYRTNQPQPDSVYAGEALVKPDNELVKDMEYWQLNRHDALSEVEVKTYSNIDSLVNMKSFQRTMDWGTALIAGYKRAGRNIEIGPMNTFYSFNPVEGLRLRFGGRTTNYFSKKYVLESYAAYGFKDERWKYYFGGSYSLTDRSIYEFPVRAISASYQHETSIPGQDLQFVQEDNFLLSFKRGENDKWLYNETFRINYLHEFENHFSYNVGFRNWRQTPAGSLDYLPAGGESSDTEQGEARSITTSEALLELRWAPGEQFFQGKLYRTPVVNRYPVFTMRAAAGIKGLYGGEYEYQKLAMNIYKRFYLSQLGYADVVTEAGYTFGQLPFPLLSIHRANQTYAYQLQSYNLMNFLEFVSDQYVSLNIDHTFNGFIFNKIPLLKKAKLREFVTFKALYGGIRSENRPENNPDLLSFPTFEDGQQATYTLGNKPYMEASVGIGNIFNFFRIDVVKRLTYLDHPHVSDIGLRGRFKLDF